VCVCVCVCFVTYVYVSTLCDSVLCVHVLSISFGVATTCGLDKLPGLFV